MRDTQTIYNSNRGRLAPLLSSTVKAFTALGLLAFYLSNSPTASAFSNQTFSKELAKYTQDGNVSYELWKKKPETLNNYIESLANLSHAELDALTKDEQKALWINAYNAFTIRLVLDNYPICGTNKDFPPDSFRQIPNAWEKAKFKVAGKEVTLEEIEHTILRRDFHDPRIHFVVVCAAKGSPHLLNHALCAKNLETDLDKAKAEFLTDERNVTFDPATNVIKVSRLFQWFPLDFACAEWFKRNKGKLPSEESVIVEYLEKNGSDTVKRGIENAEAKNPSVKEPVKVEYKDFDWSLNDRP